MRKIKDAVVKTGEYERDGQKKGRYMNVGALFQRDDGSQTLKLNALPLIQGDVWINFYDPKGAGQSAPRPGGGGESAPAGGDLDDSEIPF